MSNPNENFNQFLLYLKKSHELKAPTFLASNHYFIKDTGESNTTFEPMETDKLNLLVSCYQKIKLSNTLAWNMSI